ncbi:MAG: hypothetical protein GY904_17430 [Planctomycetaceae bacterium]|nr:hypothetical protein [Planctomycetaceae bacterium]
MNVDDFQDLYKLLRGSKSAMPVLDAKALYQERKMVAATEKLAYARETFLESRSRLIKQDVEKQVDKKAKDADRQIKKLKRKQEKLLDVVKAFDELLPQLEKSAERERQRDEKKEAAAKLEKRQQRRNQLIAKLARRCDLPDGFALAFSNADGDQQLDLVWEHFRFEEVKADEDIFGESLYLIRTDQQSFLVCTPSEDQIASSFVVASVVDDRKIKPFSRSEFLELGTRSKMVLLIRNPERQVLDREPVKEESEHDGNAEIKPGVAADESAEVRVMDMGTFSQLLTSAQRCGLVPGADQIGHVRDREFRKGQYDLAFQTIDSLFTRFSAAASQRTQRLAKEDADISSGRIKISPKDLQAKRSRDRTEGQEVERAKRRFQVVLEGLRVLMNSKESDSKAISAEK